MSTTGIIAEFNPLHNGHEYLIKEAKKNGAVVCVISGNFVQRGDTAIFEKRTRALMALKSGADLVLELPVLWSMSTAQSFALGGLSALAAAGCDKILFGSESGKIEELKIAANILKKKEFSSALANETERGITFAAARENAAKKCGLNSDALSLANNNLGVEYITAADKLGLEIEFSTVKRKGAAHDSMLEDRFVSSSYLRKKISEGDFESCRKNMPEEVYQLCTKSQSSDISLIESGILSVIRTKKPEDFESLPDLSEGLENKLYSAIKTAKNLEELYSKLKSKRYTLARIRRLVLSAFLGFDNEFFMKPLPYVRVLGFNSTGANLLKENNQTKTPIITKVSQIKLLDASAQKVFDTECRATDLYALTTKEPFECALEYTAKLVKI